MKVGDRIRVIGGALLLGQEAEVVEVLGEKGSPKRFWKLRVKSEQGRVEVVTMSNTEVVAPPSYRSTAAPTSSILSLACDVCGKTRMATLLGRLERDISEQYGMRRGSKTVVVRYCQDDFDCVAGARGLSFTEGMTPAQKSAAIIDTDSRSAPQDRLLKEQRKRLLTGLGLTAWPFCAVCGKDVDNVFRRELSGPPRRFEFEIKCHGQFEVRRFDLNFFGGPIVALGFAFQNLDDLLKRVLRAEYECSKCKLPVNQLALVESTMLNDSVVCLFASDHHGDEIFITVEIPRGSPYASACYIVQKNLDDAYTNPMKVGELVEIGDRVTAVARVFADKIIDDQGAALDPRKLVRKQASWQPTVWIPIAGTGDSAISDARLLLLEPDFDDYGDPVWTGPADPFLPQETRVEIPFEDEKPKKKPIRKIIIKDGE